MPALSPYLPLAFAAATILLTLSVGFLLTRVVRRRESGELRGEILGLVDLFEAFIEGRFSEHELRQSVRGARRAAFWSALETVALDWTRSEREKISHALERNPHSARERRALRGDSPWRRELAALRLGLLGSKRSRRALRHALPAGPEWVTYAALKSLAQDRDARALRWVLQHPRSLEHRGPQAKTALFRLFGRGALPVLTAALDQPALDRSMERAIIETLGLAHFESAATAIARRLASPDLELRIAAARALGRMEAAQCSVSLLEALGDTAWQVRAQAAWALGSAGVTQAVPALAARLEDRSWWVRRHAAYALREIAPDGLSALRHALASSQDPYARDIAREVLDVSAPASA